MREVAYMAARVFGGGFSIMLVWFAGPSWLSVPAKIFLTMLILLVWPVWILIRYFRQRVTELPPNAPPEERAEVRQRRANPSAPAPPLHTYEELTQGAREVVKLLRRSKHAGLGDPVSTLPWYVIAGPKSSGKSSLLAAAEMSFQTLPGQSEHEHTLVSPTRHCDWRVADSSVWLDTAGRYQAVGDDRDEWAALVETIKRHRKGRAIDGLVLAVSVTEVLKLDKNQLLHAAQVLRTSLNDAMRRTGDCRFPVYVVFTHMDEVKGFSEFFSSFNQKEREQVWGVTIPLDVSEYTLQSFEAEFERLYWRLISRRVLQLGTARGPKSQLRIFRFPSQFSRAQESLSRFMVELFRDTAWEVPLLRGFYFTGRNGAGPSGAKTSSGANYYFAPRLFRDVLLPDRNIVATSCHAGSKRRRWRNVLLGAAAALVVTFMVGMFVSYFKNAELIEESNELAQRLLEVRSRSGRQPTPDQLGREMVVLSEVRDFLGKLDKNERESPPLEYRFGLYAGGRITPSDPSAPSLQNIYFEAVQERFMKNAVAGVEDELRRFAASQAPAGDEAALDKYFGSHFDLLKVYLMLSHREHIEDEVDHNDYELVLRPYFKAPGVNDDEARSHLRYLASQAHKEGVPQNKPNTDLLKNVRARFAGHYSVIRHVYKGMIARVEARLKDEGRQPFSLKDVQNVTESYLKGQYEVPTAFTIYGYEEMTDRIESSAEEDFNRQAWVMSEPPPTFDAGSKSDLYQNYYNGYAGQWQSLLNDVKLNGYENKDDVAKTLTSLSGRAGPLENLLRKVAEQTYLSASRGVWGWFKSLFSSEPAPGDTPVEKQFAPLIKFALSKKEDSLTKYLQALQAVAGEVRRENKELSEISKAFQANPNTLRLKEEQEVVSSIIAAKGFGSGDATAKLLRLPLDDLYSKLGVVVIEQLVKDWQELYPQAQTLEAGYPFGSGSDVNVASVAAFFNPQDGKLASFFNDRLSPFFKNDWTPKDEAAASNFSPQFIKYLADARRLSAALFPNGGKQPGARYQLDLVNIPTDWAVTVAIDGNKPLTNEFKSRQFNWPGDGSGVHVQVSSPGEAPPDQTTPYWKEWGILRIYRDKMGGEGQSGQFTLNGVTLKLQPQPVDPRAGDLFRRDIYLLRAPKEIRPARAQ